MALTKQKKNEVVGQVSELLSSSKMTVVAKYTGTSVKAIQQLRRDARDSDTKIKVVKNRLVIKALKANEMFKDIDVSPLNGQLLYAFNSEDEVAPAQTLSNFAKQSPTIEFVGAFTAEGTFITADDVKVLANLPGKQQLRGQLVGTLAAPLTGFMGVISGNLRGIINVLNSRAESISA